MKLSASLVQTYKMCRRKYELRYVEELEPIASSQPLQDGSDYHQAIEDFYNGKGIGYEEGKNPKICAMAMAYFEHLWQKHDELKNIKYVEKWFEYPLSKKHSIVGRNDAVATCGTPVEHKTTSKDVNDEYVYDLQWNEQVLTYMLANNINEILYTVIKKPTIRQKQHETDLEFFERCVEWYREDTDNKIKLIKVARSFETIKKHKKNLIAIANEIDKCKNFYRNPTACNCYNRRCEYSQVCLDYNPEFEYIEYKKQKRYTEESKNDLF